MPEIRLMEIYRLPEGKSRAEFEYWYAQHIKDVLATPLLALIKADIQVGTYEYPRIVIIETTEENFTLIQIELIQWRSSQRRSKVGPTVFPVTSYKI